MRRRPWPMVLVFFSMILMVNTPSFAMEAPTSTRDFSAPLRSATFEVHLTGFTDNSETANIGYVHMSIDVDGSSPWTLHTEGIAGACAGWRESTGSGFLNGPSIFMSAHDVTAATHHTRVDYPLRDGILFWIDCTAPVIGLRQIYFWNADEIGDYGSNRYGHEVRLVESSSTRAVFSSLPVANAGSAWSRIKALYR